MSIARRGRTWEEEDDDAGEPAGRGFEPRRLRGALLSLLKPIALQLSAGAQASHPPKHLRWQDGRRYRATAAGRRRGRSHTITPTGIRPGAAFAAIVILGVGLASFLVSESAYLKYSSDLPDARSISSLTLPQDSLVYDSTGQLLLADVHKPGYKHYEQRLSDMGPWMPKATVAIEDANFYNEPGVNPDAMVRAAWVDYHSHGAVQGASTITQQLVKLRLVGPEPTIDRKIREAILAMQVEQHYSKDQVLEMYLNTAFYGNNAYGVAAAAQNYFHKQTKDLTLGEAAMLAGIVQNPSYNNPLVNWQGSKARQHEVLAAMVRNHMITPAEADQAYAQDISEQSGHLFADSNVIQNPAFVAYVVDELKVRFGADAPYTAGFHVTTTLDWNMYQKAAALIQDQIDRYGWGNVHQGAMVGIDPHSGAILSMASVGTQYNFAVWPPRNPGSSMKMYTYTAAIASGKFTMVSPIADSPISYVMGPGEPPYVPRNYDGRFHGTCQLQACFLNSLNVPATKVEMGLPNGPSDVAQIARNMGAPPWHCADPPGCQHFTNNDPLDSYGISLTLGGWGETPLQMATGASVLAAEGVLHQPTSIARITNPDGQQIYKLEPMAGAKQVLDPRVAFILEQIMSDDSNRAMIFGHGSNLTLSDHKVASKTGTTDDYRDGWTVGYTPAIATAFWFGNADFTPMYTKLEASVIAAPVWHDFMEWALSSDLKRPGDEWFGEPSGLVHYNVGGKLQWFLPGTSPSTPVPPPQGTVQQARKP